jgi:hypothetical protein
MDIFSENKKEADRFVYFFLVEISGIEPLTCCADLPHSRRRRIFNHIPR